MSKYLFLAFGLIVSSLIMGIALFAIQVMKQQSIERQQIAEIQQESQQSFFTNNLKCQELLVDLKKRWNNIVGVKYSESYNTCMVKYSVDGEVNEAPMEEMQDTRE